jgi:hypothetical protein
VSLVNEICSRHDFLKGDNRMVFKDFPAPVVDLMVEK